MSFLFLFISLCLCFISHLTAQDNCIILPDNVIISTYLDLQSTSDTSIRSFKTLVLNTGLFRRSLLQVGVGYSLSDPSHTQPIQSIRPQLIEQISRFHAKMYWQDDSLTGYGVLFALLDWNVLSSQLPYLVYVSPDSYFLNVDLFSNCYNDLPENVYCTKATRSDKDLIMGLLSGLQPNLNAMHLRASTLEALGGLYDDESLMCGSDILVLDRNNARVLVRQIRNIYSNFYLSMNTKPDMDTNKELSGRSLSPDYRLAMAMFLLNVALLEEGIGVRELLPYGQDSSVGALHSGVVTFRPGDSLTVSVDKQECAVHMAGLSDAVSSLLQASLEAHPNTCAVLSGFSVVVPRASFLEIGSAVAFARAGPGTTGLSLVRGDEEHSAFNRESVVTTHRLLSVLAYHKVTISQGSYLLAQSLNTPMYVRVGGCLDSRHVFHYGRSGGCVGADTEEGSDIGEEMLEVYSTAAATELPCVLVVSPGLRDPYQLASFDNAMLRLGMVQMDTHSADATLAIGPHCSIPDFASITDLMTETSVIKLLRNLWPFNLASLSKKKEEVSPRTFRVSAGVALLDRKKATDDHIAVVENILPPRLLALLLGRLYHRANVDLGANSHFIWFNESYARPRSLVEMVILDYLAPLAVGSEEEALAAGFVGAEWWIQARGNTNPKEYHMDTAITWCRDNGWSKDLLAACHFYPDLGSVNYLTDTGGPTVVFNQAPTRRGLYPPTPDSVGVVFPKKNRMALFKGNRFHGVLRSDESSDKRVTLLVNYWRNKTAGESFTHVMPQEEIFMRRGSEISASEDRRCSRGTTTLSVSGIGLSSEGADHSYEGDNSNCAITDIPVAFTPSHAYVDRDFADDMYSWQQQTLPEFYSSLLADGSSDIEPRRCSDVALSSLLRGSVGSNYSDEMCQIMEEVHNNGRVPPAVIFHLNRNIMKEMCDRDLKNLSLHHWTMWTKDDNTVAGYNVVTSNTVDNLMAWRESMPGNGNEDIIENELEMLETR